MISIQELQSALLELLHELEGTDVNLIIGGGYGIYRKVERVQRLGARTLLHELPEARSTNDLDLFLRPELLIESEKLKPLTAAFGKLGYKVVAGAEKYQFMKPGPGGDTAGSIKIDLLTGTRSTFENTSVGTDGRRARPTPSVGIHAHTVDEALTLNEGLTLETIEGTLGTGEPWHGEIFLPHTYTFLLMKLFAFRDRFKDEDKEYGRYHALDVYTILAAATEEEWETALLLRNRFKEAPCVMEAGRIVKDYFSALDRYGLIRLRESPYFRPQLELDAFMSALQELFPPAS